MRVDSLAIVVAALPVLALLVGSWLLVRKVGAPSVVAQLVGAACLLVVVIVHFCEANNLFPQMGWGQTDSVGHYIDLASVLLSLILFPLGYLLYALRIGRS